MLKHLIWIILATTSFSSYGQNPIPEEQIAQFSQAMASPDFGKAVDTLFRQNEEAQFNNFDLAQWKEKLKTEGSRRLFDRGKYFGMELAKEERYSPSLRRMVYVQKFERGVVFWEFYFYKPSDRWVIMQFNMSNDLAQGIEQMGF